MSENRITRFSPAREMQQMRDLFDRFFDDWRPFMDESRLGSNLLALDVHEDASGYTIRTDLPGVSLEHINVRKDGEYLLIEATIPEQTVEQEGERTLIRERRSGSFSRRVRLPNNIDIERAEADFDNGVLTLTLPKAADAQPRTIEIKRKA
ncbi:MAG: Hsp20/alpha crystallin family protein [Chloroflexi bacterium]|nr:Hsp20/alpha crystallin family protein [Chloroflexota bacterium]